MEPAPGLASRWHYSPSATALRRFRLRRRGRPSTKYFTGQMRNAAIFAHTAVGSNDIEKVTSVESPCACSEIDSAKT